MLRTRSPLAFDPVALHESPFDLHVLTTPPAFILSQDQTLRKESSEPSDSRTTLRVRLLSHAYSKYLRLIGGPNQSHKVNLKEPLPSEGKISTKTTSFFSVNTFSVENGDLLERNGCRASGRFFRPTHCSRDVGRREGDNGNLRS